MTTPSVPRCGRLDAHEPHVWLGHPLAFRLNGSIVQPWHDCPGHVVTEGAQPCVACQRPVASCRCAELRAYERNREWDS